MVRPSRQLLRSFLRACESIEIWSWLRNLAFVVPAKAHCCPGFCSGLSSLESEASLRVGRAQGGWFGRRGCVRMEAERATEAEFEAGEEQRGAVLERAGRGLLQDAQQQKGDQRDIDLGAHGVLAAADKAADLEVLLEPLEQQLDLPALFVELRDVGGGTLEIVGEQIERLVVIGAGDDDLAQLGLVKRVDRRAAARLAMTDLEAAVGHDPVARGGLLAPLTALRVALAPGEEDGIGGDDLRPPAVIGIAL